MPMVGPERGDGVHFLCLPGGQLQRAMVAMAMSCKPDIIVFDEPTTALDVTVQAEVLSLLSQLVDEEKMSLIFITHDLPVIAQIANQLLVLQNGRIVEQNTVSNILTAPEHPTTINLLEAARRVTTVPYVNERAGSK